MTAACTLPPSLIYQVVRSPISASGADEALGPAAGRKIPFAGFLGEQTFGPEHYEVASNLHNLAAVLCTRGDPDQAERLYLRALTIKEKRVPWLNRWLPHRS